MLIGSARRRCSWRLRNIDTINALLFRMRGALVFLFFELLVIFAALGLGAVGVIKTVDRLLDEEPLSFSALVFHTSPAARNRARGTGKDSRLVAERNR
jgi:hypothetical protein